MTSGAWLTLLRDDLKAFAGRIVDTAALAGDDSADANYWCLSRKERSSFESLPADFEVGSIADDLAMLTTLRDGFPMNEVHLEAMASILLHIAVREEQK